MPLFVSSTFTGGRVDWITLIFVLPVEEVRVCSLKFQCGWCWITIGCTHGCITFYLQRYINLWGQLFILDHLV